MDALVYLVYLAYIGLAAVVFALGFVVGAIVF
jgi:hypothetical protein